MFGTTFIASTTIFLLVVIGATQCWSLPKSVCTSIRLRDTKKPTSVVGIGTPASCTQSALAAALLKGGTITFNCGAQPVTIPITSELTVSSVTDTIIDGAGLVTLDGTGKTRILKYVAGGAVWTIGGGDTTVVGSVFIGNKCSNGGGLGILGSGLIIQNSQFENNQATGNGGNPGNGGNGGAISFDGRGRNNTICGTRFTRNQANKFGGAFFRVSYNGNEQNKFDNLLIDSNFISVSGDGLAGGLYIQGGTASIRDTTIANNSASGAGGIFFANDNGVTLNNVNLVENRAYTSLGGAVFCSNPVSGVFSGLTVANNIAGAFSAAFASCTETITLANSIIANSTVGNPWPANACITPMSDGRGVIQSPINKQTPASGVDTACTNGASRINNVVVTLDRKTWKIKVTGAQTIYLGPTVVPGL